MIRTEKNMVINTIIEKFFIEGWFKDLNPIIAGGSVLYLYQTFKDPKSYASRQILSQINRLEKITSNRGLNNSIFDPKIYSGLYNYSGDIDVWFSSQESLDEALMRSEFVTVVGRETNWAKTCRPHRMRVFANIVYLQIVKKSYDTPNDLIGSFDIANSMIAWKDGTLYIDDRLDESFEDGEVRYVNNPFNSKISIQSKVFHALRLFKYSTKHTLSFSDEINKIILDLYLEVDDLADPAPPGIIVAGHYGEKNLSEFELTHMVDQFVKCFSSWYCMRTFPEENLLFFLSIKSDRLGSIKHFVEAALVTPPDIFVDIPLIGPPSAVNGVFCDKIPF